MQGSYLDWQVRHNVIRPIVAFRAYISRDLLPQFNNLDQRAEQVASAEMKPRSVSLFALLLIMAGAVLFRGRHSTDSDETLERAIWKTTATHRWVLPILSKYISYNYPERSKLRLFAEMNNWPGYVDRGLGKQSLQAALSLANVKYGLHFDGVRINAEPNPTTINLYFFDPEVSPEFGRFRKQCAYVGFENIILCDARFLFQFQEVSTVEHELDSYLAPGQHFSTLIDSRQPTRVYFLLQDLAATQHVLTQGSLACK
jgi:hypothetical protein